MLVASELATSGSVIAKALRIRPSSSGTSHSALWASVPYRSSTSMLPVSGAEQLKISEAMGERPMTSQSEAYSRLVSPAPWLDSGRNRFQSPSARALVLSVSMMAVGFHRSAATWAHQVASLG